MGRPAGGPYCSPALPSVCGRQFEPLAGQGGGFWDTELHQHCHHGAWGASSNRVAKKNARYPGLPPLWRKTWPGWLRYAGPPRGDSARWFLRLSSNWQISTFFEPSAIGSLPVTPCRWVHFGSMVSDRAAHDVPVVCRSDVHRNKGTYEQVGQRFSYRLTASII